MRIIYFTLSFLLFSFIANAQEKQSYRVGAIGFYNFENLFDTADDPRIKDEEFTPKGANNWTPELYQQKLENLAKVVAEMGTDVTPDGMGILGVAEVENRKVLEDFVAHPKLRDRKYQIVHFDSPDFRGIDVALLYQAKYFSVETARAIPLALFEDNGTRKYTRDILMVSGSFDGDPIHVFVNHWPSRSGGASATQAYRNAAALKVKILSDSLMQLDPKAKIVIMGDLNDDPSSPSVKKVLGAKAKTTAVKEKGFFNPMYTNFKKGLGTLAYRDAWNLFDQIIISEGLVNAPDTTYRFYSARVFSPNYLYQKTGHFKGYPFRSFSGNTYIGGYSDHFPVYIFLIKSI
ncbi:MAG: endonuclease/exonuclease/phosphatase family protein [Saprospiraceae bacterium]